MFGSRNRRINATLKVLDQKTWARHPNLDKNETCLYLAMFEANANAFDLYMSMTEKIHKLGFRCIVDWNDAPGRTKDEVIAMLESFRTPAWMFWV